MVVTCAGREALLIPVGEYSTQRMVGIFGNNKKGYRSARTANYGNADSVEYYSMMRNTTCDAEGNFEFKNVANGDYYVFAQVLWSVSDYSYEGGNLMQKISISRGKSQRVLLSN